MITMMNMNLGYYRLSAILSVLSLYALLWVCVNVKTFNDVLQKENQGIILATVITIVWLILLITK